MSKKVDIYPFSHPTNKESGWASQWYACNFKDDKGEEYTSMEQYMMIKKALLFQDADSAAVMRKTNDPKTLLKLGRQVKNFVQEVWDKHKEEIVENGNYLKFSQNAALKQKLLETGAKQIVETFSHDRIWSCGLSYRDPNVYFPDRWPGLNLLGKCLDRVRNRLSSVSSSSSST